MRVLLYSLNHAPELTGIGKYNGEMVQWLVAQGHQVQVVTAPPYYPAWRVSDGFANAFDSSQQGGATVLRCPLYVPAQPSTLKRLLHLASFALSSVLGLWRSRGFRPDVVLLIEPTLFCAPAGLLFARFVGARAWLHVQDYEVDAMLGLGLMRGGWLGRAARAVDGWLMRRFDRVSSISASMLQIARSKGVPDERLVFFPNWVDTDVVSPQRANKALYRQRWGIADDTRVVLYAGNMGAKQGLELVIQAAQALQGRADVLFVLVGQGAAVADLKQQAQTLGLRNLRFEPLQPFEDLPHLLALADVHLVVQKMGAADVVLPSKLTGILAAGGHALITAEAHTELGLLCQQHPGIATRAEPESLPAFVDGLNGLLARPLAELRQPNAVARRYAEAFLNQHAVLQRFEADVLALLGHTAQEKRHAT